MRRLGSANPHLRRAATTRSRDSLTAESGSPTSVYPGRPGEQSTSTRTSFASTPQSVPLTTQPIFRSRLFSAPAADGRGGSFSLFRQQACWKGKASERNGARDPPRIPGLAARYPASAAEYSSRTAFSMEARSSLVTG